MKISVIVPIYKEPDPISFLENLLKSLSDFQHEIIFVDGDHDGSSLKKIEYSNVIKKVSRAKGRGIQLSEGVNCANGDIIVFLHADTTLSKDNFYDILNSLTNGFDYGAFKLRINSQKYLYRIVEFFVLLRTKLFKLPYGDQTIFIKKDTLIKIGGVKEIPLLEDIELMERCKKNRLRFYFSRYYSTTSPRRWEKIGILRTALRNLLILILYKLGVNEKKLYEIYYYQ